MKNCCSTGHQARQCSANEKATWMPQIICSLARMVEVQKDLGDKTVHIGTLSKSHSRSCIWTSVRWAVAGRHIQFTALGATTLADSIVAVLQSVHITSSISLGMFYTGQLRLPDLQAMRDDICSG